MNNASDKEVPQEEITRSEATARAATEALRREFIDALDRERRDRFGTRHNPTREQQEHVAKRAARQEAFREEAAKANRALKQKREQVKYLVHVKVGGDLSGDQPVWIPSTEDVEEARQEWQDALGDEFLVVATHCLTEIEVWPI